MAPSDYSTRRMSPGQPILGDVNLWLATLAAEHPHHQAVTSWWQVEVLAAGEHVAFVRQTQLGLLRLLSNERVMGRGRLDRARAWTTVKRLIAQPCVDFLEEPPGIDPQLDDLAGSERSSPTFWSDAYLVAIARAGGYRLATFDRGFRRYDGLEVVLLGP